MKLQYTFAIFIILLLSNKASSQSDSIIKKEVHHHLELLWQTEPVLTTIESIVYDDKKQQIYASNIEGKPADKDSVGSISIIDLDGKIINRDWITGMNAPKGMGIYNGALYVTDIDRIHQIDIKLGKIVKTYDIEGAVFLNDLAISSDGTIYFSDTDKGKIHTLKDGKSNVWMEFDSPNGLYVEDSTLLVVSWNNKSFNRININTQKNQIIAEQILHPDGIEAIGNGSHFVSSWDGMVHLINKSGEKYTLLDTSNDKINAADIEFIIEKNMLLVPTFFSNTILAFKYNN